jgi:hypothetical protein
MTLPCKFDVVDLSGHGQFPRGFANLPFEAQHRAVIRFGGGCGKADAATMAQIPDYVRAFADGIACVVTSGGTVKFTPRFDAERNETVYEADGFMVTYVPAMLKGLGFPVIAASTTPRTQQMVLDENYGGVIVSGLYRIDHRQDHAVIVQPDALEIADPDWIADVPPYLEVAKAWSRAGVPQAWVGMEGGSGTVGEAKLFLGAGIPCVFTAGSGRAMDSVLIAEFEAGKLMIPDGAGDLAPVDPALVRIVPFLDGPALNGALKEFGVIA